jgi:hypothetical protein
MGDAQKAHHAMRQALGISLVVQDDHGRFRFGINDDGPVFETRNHAAAVIATRWPNIHS